MSIALLASIVSLLMINVGALFAAYVVTAVRHDRWRRRAPAMAAGRAVLAEIAARGPGGIDLVAEAHVPELSRLRDEELSRVLSQLAPSVDGDSLAALRTIAAERGLIAEAQRDLVARSWVERLAAARFLTALGEPMTQQQYPLFTDRAAAVRNQMAIWAANSRDTAPVDHLIRLLSDRDGYCRFSAKDTLVRLGVRSTKALVQILRDPESPAVTAALEVAAALSDPAFAAPAVQLAGSRSPQQRALAAAVLGSSGGAATTTALRALLRDEDADVRRAAVSAVAEQGDWSVAATVADLLNDPSWPVRREASSTLLRLGAPGLILLREAARSTGGAAAMAAQTLQIHGLATGRAA